VGVHVDETRRQDVAGGIDTPGRTGFGVDGPRSPDPGHDAAGHEHVGDPRHGGLVAADDGRGSEENVGCHDACPSTRSCREVQE